MKHIFTLWMPVFCLSLFSARVLAQANTSLSNLETPTLINSSLLPGSTNAYNLGSPGRQWNNLFVNNLTGTGTTQLSNVSLAGTTQFFGQVLLSPTAIFNGNTLSFLGTGGLSFAGGGQINFNGPGAIKMSGGGNITINAGSFNLTRSNFTITPGNAGVLLSDASGNITTGSLTLAQIPSLATLYLPLTGGQLTGRLEGTEARFSGAGRFGSLVTDGLRVGGTTFPAATGTVGQVLTADGSGGAGWVTLPRGLGGNGGWSLTGNAGTVDGTNFIGTTDNVPFTVRVNNIPSGRIDHPAQNAFWGYGSGSANTYGMYNTGFGDLALFQNTTAHANTAVGNNALGNCTTGSSNTGIGGAALSKTITGYQNTAVGGFSLTSNGSGYNLTAIGYGTNVGIDGLTNSTAIGYGAILNASNVIQLGNNAVDSIYAGVGTAATLVTGGLRVTGGNLAAGSVLTSDANGVATWQALPTSTGTGSGTPGWSLTGNAGTIDGTNFIGTTDNVPLTIRVNNIPSGRIDHPAQNAFWGYGSGSANTYGMYNTGFGDLALFQNTTAHANTAVGNNALGNCTIGSSNTGIGGAALSKTITGYQNTAVGGFSLTSNGSGYNLTAIGYGTNVGIDGLTNSTAIGYGAILNASNVIQLGNNAVDSIYAGVGTAATLVTGGLRVTGGNLAAGSVLTSDANGVATWQALPTSTGTGSGTPGWSLTGNAGTIDGTNFIGTTDNVPLTIRVYNNPSGRIDQNLENASWGFNAAANNTTGNNSVSIGSFSMYGNATGNLNTAIGYYSLNSNVSGNSNTAVGANALVATLGTENTGVGSNALQGNVNGSDVTAIGSNAGPGLPNLTNSTAIGANAVVTGSNDIQLGSATVDSVYVGVGKAATLVTGGLIVKGGTLAAGNVLTSDANGVATWQAPASGSGTGSSAGWSLTGNTGTVDGTNFIGTTDYEPFNVRVNNYPAGRLDEAALNTFWGVEAGLNDQPNAATYTGIENTLIGQYAGQFNNTGSQNTGVGSFSLYANAAGKECTAIGYGAGTTIDGLNNATAIGYTAFATASNQAVIGNAYVTSIGGYANWTNFSDGRYKQNIKRNVPGLAFINALQPITYTLDIAGIENKLHANRPAVKGADGKALPQPAPDQSAMTESASVVHTGFIAQDVDKAAQNLGYDFSGVDRPKDAAKSFYGLRYGDFVVPLVAAVQELSSKNDSLTAVVAQLQDSLNSVVAQMNDRLNRLEAILETGAVGKSSTSAVLSSARLFQNVPDPFNQTTLINYYLPENTGSALIQVTDMNGVAIKSVALNGTGSGQLTLATTQLAAGAYAYTLIVDGNIVDTKKMLLVK